jgi:NADPH:quinone reductase-like Zn-dependent oxidoreductase
MKAVTIDGYGFDRVSVRDMPEPEPGPLDVIVRIHAGGLNHLDLWTLEDALGIEHDFPHILGADGAGEVLAVGSEVRGLSIGSRVMIDPALSCGSCEFCRAGEQSICTTFRMMGEHTSGLLAELVNVPLSNVYPLPAHLSYEEGAALGTAWITAYRMLFTRGRLQPGEWVLVTGIGGGLALALFQLAKQVAGKIFVTSSSDEKLGRATALGADGTVNYREGDVGKAIRGLTAKRGVDLVVDSAGGDALDGALRSLRKGGRLVNAGATAGSPTALDVRRLFWNQLEVIGSTMGSASDVSNMLRMVAGSEMRPIIHRTYAIDEAPEALRELKAGGQFGKIVLAI